MQMQDLENEVEFLLRAALRKCGRLHDAEDLTQETLLAAVTHLAKGGEIRDGRAWLLTVLGRKFNDRLRQKYRMPTVSVGELPDVPDERSDERTGETGDEAEKVRRAVAYLAGTYREVIVRHYLKGQGVEQIAKDLRIPAGTVKSRLHLGREQLKKGYTEMENTETYAEQSYDPVRLILHNSGLPGLNGEPYCLLETDLLAQNVLWYAYPRPATAAQISRALGMPTAYVEPVLRKLTDGELMKQVGNRFYTDFMISTVKDREKYVPAQKQFVHDNFPLFRRRLEDCLHILRTQVFYDRLSPDARNGLELYAVFHALDYGTFIAIGNAFHAEQRCPERPNGGRWIAFGDVLPRNFDHTAHPDLYTHGYSGERGAKFDGFAGSTSVELRIYGADGFPCLYYSSSPDYAFAPQHFLSDAEVMKLLYLIHTDTPPEQVGVDPAYLGALPHLTACKLFREENGKPVVNLPVLTKEEANFLWNVCGDATLSLANDLLEPLADFLRGKAQKIPAHLDSVPLQKQYMNASGAILFATVRECMAQGVLYDGHYDDDSNGVNQPPCPMVLVIEK